MRRRICVVTGSRAEFGLLRPVMEGIRDAEGCELLVVATGTHLAPEFGSTAGEIEDAGFRIDHRVEMLVSGDTATATAKSIGLGVIGFADALASLAPDLLVVLGDRFEILSAVLAALPARVPVAHLHGGETTEGAFDEAIRHAITKMSHLHFVAAEEYRRRVIQLGEEPARVFMVGGLGVDSIRRLRLLGRAELEAALGLSFGDRALLITFHPATLDDEGAGGQMEELLAALEPLADTTLVFTMPNADTGGRSLMRQIEQFVAGRRNAHAFTSLGQLRYLSCLQYVDGVVGNSSSGLAEVPSFRKGTIDIGDRQRGRLRAESVIGCAPRRAAIGAAIRELYSPAFQERLRSVRNPYGDGGASDRIVTVLQNHPLESIVRKAFHDLDG